MMDPVTLSLPAAAALNCEPLQHYQTRTVSEMTLLSPRTTFSPLELNNKKGFLNNSAPCVVLLLRLHLLFSSFLQQRSRKQIKHGNWKNDWTFSLAEDGGELQVGGRTLCVFGGGLESRWREEGGGV